MGTPAACLLCCGSHAGAVLMFVDIASLQHHDEDLGMTMPDGTQIG